MVGPASSLSTAPEQNAVPKTDFFTQVTPRMSNTRDSVSVTPAACFSRTLRMDASAPVPAVTIPRAKCELPVMGVH